MAKPNAQPIGQRLQAKPRLLWPSPPGDRSRATVLHVRNGMVMRFQASHQHAKIKAGVVSDQAIIAQRRLDLRPQLAKFGFVTHHAGRDAVDLNVGG